MSEAPQSPWEYYISRHDWLSHKFSWHRQHTIERFLDLSGFIASISGQLEPERHEADDFSMLLGFFEVEQPSRIRYVYLIFLFTVLERRARALCQVVRESDPEVAIDLRDLGGTLFDRLKTFCEKAARIPLADLSLWESIQQFQKVRDCIVHCGGCIRDSRDAEYIRRVISRDCGLAESSRGYLQVGASYCSHAENKVLTFLDTFFSAAQTTLRERLLKRQSTKSDA